ncbi:DUF5825 family protein [Gandjariella thermophila]|uniref:DUF5825 family protein n=1 Tax=Gandjariella thermophila TaxID=1931992 RepID=UPI0010F956CE|nr:DUF5825 family protein [Gandjariella thermophila]
MDPAAWSGRQSLVEVVRLGFRQIVLSGRHDLSEADWRGAWRLLQLVREAMGVGLRVNWYGSVPEPLRPALGHLDPPLGADGVPAWRAASDPYPRIRFGAGFAVVSRSPEDASVLSGPAFELLWRAWPAPTEDWSPEDIEQLNSTGLICLVGPYPFVTPVRYRVMR